MFNGITGVPQKQGSAEAVPVGSKRVAISLILFYIIPQYLIFVKYIKNCIFLYDKLTGERSFSVIFLRKRPTGPVSAFLTKRYDVPFGCSVTPHNCDILETGTRATITLFLPTGAASVLPCFCAPEVNATYISSVDWTRRKARRRQSSDIPETTRTPLTSRTKMRLRNQHTRRSHHA